MSGDLELPVDSHLMFKIADLATRYNVPVVIHAEAEPHTVEQMKRLLDRSSRARVIWAHNISIVQYRDGRITGEMRALLEAFPDRFSIGTDTAHPLQYPRYADLVEAFRLLLSQLSPDTARKIGYENGERLFRRRLPARPLSGSEGRRKDQGRSLGASALVRSLWVIGDWREGARTAGGTAGAEGPREASEWPGVGEYYGSGMKDRGGDPFSCWSCRTFAGDSPVRLT